MATLPAAFPHSSFSSRCENMRLTELNETLNPFSAFVDIFRGTAMTLRCYSQMKAYSNWFSDMAGDISYYWSYSLNDVYVIVIMAIIWTLVRHFFEKSVFQPFGRWVGVLDHNLNKFAESLWKTLAYSFLWSSAAYVTFFRGYDFFQQPMKIWQNQRYDVAPVDLCLIYALEASFYVHSIYSTIYMDAWRKDSVVMIVHHLVTLILVISSYAFSFLKIGVLIFVLDDFGDIVLESGKAATYMRNRKTGFSRFFDKFSNIAGAIFAIQWAVLRLQLHVTKVWRSAAIGSWMYHPQLPVPFHLFFVGFLGSLFVFYAYWFVFIVMFVVRILRGQQGSAEDPREDDAVHTANRRQDKAVETESTPPMIIYKKARIHDKDD